MNEDFVNFEIAKKLKEKGFREKCFGYYAYCGNVIYYYIIQNPVPSRQLTFKDFKDCKNVYKEIEKYDAPTIPQVLKWLREALEIDILPKIVISWCGNLNRIRSYSCNIYSPRLNKPIETEYFESPEEATLAGIEYVLDNLI